MMRNDMKWMTQHVTNGSSLLSVQQPVNSLTACNFSHVAGCSGANEQDLRSAYLRREHVCSFVFVMRVGPSVWVASVGWDHTLLPSVETSTPRWKPWIIECHYYRHGMFAVTPSHALYIFTDSICRMHRQQTSVMGCSAKLRRLSGLRRNTSFISLNDHTSHL